MASIHDTKHGCVFWRSFPDCTMPLCSVDNRVLKQSFDAKIVKKDLSIKLSTLHANLFIIENSFKMLALDDTG